MTRINGSLALALFGAFLTLGWTGTTVLGDEDDLARELPRIKPLEPEAALKSFKVREGFRLEPVAVEPLVMDPVSVCFDADGRIYSVEMRGYPYPENSPTGNVRRLEDRDGDGKYETSTIFVDGLSWPTAIVPYNGGVLIGVAPDILFARDNDGDGVADEKKVMFTGFGTQNVQGLVNGLLWGLDGWIYGVSGGNGGLIQNLSRPEAKPVSIRGRDFRFKPDGSAFEAISGGGQFGHSFDDWGHRFTCNNSNHLRQILIPSLYLERNPALAVPAVLDDIAAEGPAALVYRISPPEPWRVVRTRQRAADPVMSKRLPRTELFATGFFTSATGVTIYRGTAFPSEFRGNAFIGDVGGNLVHRKIMSRNGAESQGTRGESNVEFLASTDNWFRPVNFANTPDGTLLIIDMYRETIEHPASIPEPIKKHLDLTSGKDRGRLYHLVPEGFQKRKAPALSKASTAELVIHLADPDAWWRETAQRLLIERRDPAAIPLLKTLAETRPNPLGRLHALATLDVVGGLTDDLVLKGLADPEPGVREFAARLAEPRAGSGPAVRAALLALADDPEPMVRFQAAFSIGAVSDPRALDALAAIAVRDSADRWTRAAVLSSIAGRTLPLIDRLSKKAGFFETPPGHAWLDELAVLVGAENQPAAVQALLARFVVADADPGLVRTVVLGLGRGLQRSGGSLRAALQGPGGAQLAPLFARAVETAHSESSEATRVNAIRLLGLGPVESALEVLPDLLDTRQPGAVQLAALQTLAGLPGPRVGALVIGHWKGLSPTVRREAEELLFSRPDRQAALLDAIEEKTITPSDLDLARRKQLLASPDEKLRERAARLFGNDPRSDRGQVIAAFRPALTLTGNREKGRAVFLKTCSTCHRAEGQGTDVGPNLVTITGRTPEDLLIHILDPNREVAPIYLNYNVATKDGRVVTGLIAEESANAVTLKRAEGVTEVVPRNRIEEIASTSLSLMPEGLEKGLEPRDFADLIAFLRSLPPEGPTAPPAR
jgi:putative membrane-bound dehydrogenase-like protein